MTTPPDIPARTPPPANPGPHPWRRYVAIGDSFTEGVGDPEPGSPGGFRGWADRVAEVLASQVDDFAYANLAVRGKLIAQIVADQVEPALALRPDLITLSAGGNDVIRPGTDPDVVAQQFEDAVIRLTRDGATLVIFTGIDTNFTPVFRGIRGKVAIYNENLRAIAESHDCIVADQWGLKVVQDMRFFTDDRLHYNSLGHHEVARMVLRALNVPNDLQPMQPDPLPATTWRAARAHDLVWAREHLVPWVLRRLRHESSGDLIPPKRPDPLPVAAAAAAAAARAESAHAAEAHEAARAAAAANEAAAPPAAGAADTRDAPEERD
jgi:lysophospholipase L1-like esterase